MPTTLRTKANAIVPVRVSLLVVLLVVNAAGILLLFVKSELDVQQIRNEIGLVWREGQVGYVTQNQVSQDTQDVIKDEQAQQTAVSAEEFYASHAWKVYTHNFDSRPIQIDDVTKRSLSRVFTDNVALACDPTATSTASSTPCDPTTKTMSVTIDLYSVGNWTAGDDHVFYLRVPGTGGPRWYGPFVDNIARLKQEAGK